MFYTQKVPRSAFRFLASCQPTIVIDLMTFRFAFEFVPKVQVGTAKRGIASRLGHLVRTSSLLTDACKRSQFCPLQSLQTSNTREEAAISKALLNFSKGQQPRLCGAGNFFWVSQMCQTGNFLLISVLFEGYLHVHRVRASESIVTVDRRRGDRREGVVSSMSQELWKR